jgi:hypothetical protein
MEEIRVTIFKNSKYPKDGKMLLVRRNQMNFNQLLNKCSEKLSNSLSI